MFYLLHRRKTVGTMFLKDEEDAEMEEFLERFDLEKQCVMIALINLLVLDDLT